jgi:mannose-6-phosphate isomerase-like protein (cupin superfamily)
LQGKIWGKTETIIKTPTMELHRLEINPNSRCSMHKHEFKHNCFMVSTGRLIIEVEKNAYDLVDKTYLGPGDVTTVAPNEYHRFVTEDEGCTGFEAYYLEPLSEDIIRKDVGGKA